jgi:diaminopimelate decarboxylase
MITETVSAPLSIRDNQLFIEDMRAADIVAEFGSPVFVVSEAKLTQNARTYRAALESAWTDGPVKVMGALKASPVTAIQRILTREGIGCDTFGLGEVELAVRSGVAPEMLNVNGSIKGRDVIARAIELGCMIILDSPRELHLAQEVAAQTGKRAKVALRMKPIFDDLDSDSDFFPARKVRDMTQTVKYGIPTTELLAMLPDFANCPDVDLVGAHMHVGRHTKRIEDWQIITRTFAAWIKRCADGLGGWRPDVVSLGGGFAAQGDVESRVVVTDYPTPTIAEFAKAVADGFREGMINQGLTTDGITLEIEPGRGLHNDTGIHLARVHNVKVEKEGLSRKWIETDTSECFLSIPGLSLEPPFPYMIATKAGLPATDTADLSGITCNYECLLEQGLFPNDVAEGDVLAFLNTGSYIEPYTCNFNALPRPGIVLVSGDQAMWIKRPETVDDVFARDMVPAHLVAN